MFLYKIQSNIDQKQYVGITNDIMRRWKEHRTELRGGRHGNPHLQAAWNLYDEENFSFEVIQEFKSREYLEKAEIEYISKNNLLDPNNGYNLSAGGCGSFTHTEDARTRISKSQEKAVVSMCLKTGEIKRYGRILDVVVDGLNPKSISNPCTDRALTYAGKVWMYEEEYLRDPQKLTNKRNSSQNVKARPSRYRPVFGMNIRTKELVSYEAGYHAKKDGFSHQCIHKCCVSPEVSKSHRGFVWSYDKNTLSKMADRTKNGNANRKAIYKFSLDGSLIGTVDRDGLSESELRTISSVCSGEKLSHKKFLYSYVANCKNQQDRYFNFYRSFLKKDKNGNVLKKYNNISELLNDNKQIGNVTNIYRCCLKERKTAHGFVWCFSEDSNERS
jgi:group I intron endonuclease